MKIKLSELKKLIKESLHETQPNAAGDVEEAIGGLGIAFRENLANSYDDADPSMSSVGAEGWEQQVDAAVEDLTSQVSMLVSEVSEKLMNGEYYV